MSSHGNVRRFIEGTAVPPLSDEAQRIAGAAAAAAAFEESFGIHVEDFQTGIDAVSGAANSGGSIRITEPDPDIPQHATAAAFFDVDNTLIQGSSLILLAMGLYRKKFFTLKEILPVVWMQVKYRVKGSELPDAMVSGRALALEFIKGRRVDELQAICREMVDKQLLDRTYQGTRELAQMHIDAGEQVWLVSATPVQVGQMLAERLGFTGALGTVAEEQDGVFTGRLIGDILHGPGKQHAVAALTAIQQFDLEQCTAYSDSSNDIPMLSMVGTAVAINPDKELRHHAKSHGWLIRDYRSVRRVFSTLALPALAASAVAAAAALAFRSRP
ncbi:HAD-IB family hydrolase [Corynebacterium aquatimens]|uniref:HAD superfamily hydrolase (TIGR01490 family) n=1 Tax=Corynebacterium aquatimens TaxID=1190508 RepID=A0A931GU66_9CORY|nr:HAD-IB family hydrolase [Corynebacterium aquatimens]MBG6122460.1 HAD superfamily hydrolase (TIGR01490 family) [Corynebacterium aquatimens]WJY65000.1 phosphoserine phosphatase [Corynebacterium aquatimens]